MLFFVLWYLAPAFIHTCRRSCREYIAPPLLKAIIMAAWVSWHCALCVCVDKSVIVAVALVCYVAA